MFDAPADAPFLWLGVAAVSLVALATVASFPTTQPPDATRIAATVDRVAASPPGSTARLSVAARSVRLGTSRVSLRNRAGTATATLVYGATPATSGGLRAVLAGARPGGEFSTPAAFRAALSAAREGEAGWQSASELTVRRVAWEGVNATLVG